MISRRLMMMLAGGPTPPPPPEEVKAIKFSSDLPNGISLNGTILGNISLEYSRDGEEWTDWDFSNLMFGGEYGELYIRGNNPAGMSTSNATYTYFVEASGNTSYRVSGNAMYLLGQDVSDVPLYGFLRLFMYCTHMTSAPELPATTLGAECYEEMFKGCTNLVDAPELPATTLRNYCYKSMFMNCTNLAIAPELPATTLSNYCYQYMFFGCTRLNEVRCSANNVSPKKCVDSWMSGVSSSGTFYKNQSATWPEGASGIPSGWTVINM